VPTVEHEGSFITGCDSAIGGVMYPYRVFLSYAHADRAVVEQVSFLLQDLGVVPVWDRNIRPGSRFTDCIFNRAQRWLDIRLSDRDGQLALM